MKTPQQTLGKIIRHFKAKAAKKIHDTGFTGFRWQSKYHDRIIRNEDELDRIRLYIRNNPVNWREDEENPVS
jgi:putative transposase